MAVSKFILLLIILFLLLISVIWYCVYDKDYKILNESCAKSRLEAIKSIDFPLYIIVTPFGREVKKNRPHHPYSPNKNNLTLFDFI